MDRTVGDHGVTMDSALYDEIASRVASDFAYSYFLKAHANHTARTIEPYTLMAWERISKNVIAVKIMAELKWKLVKPAPYGDSSRPDTVERMHRIDSLKRL